MKHQIIYCVYRQGPETNFVILNSYYTFEEADNERSAYEQECKDRGVNFFQFHVQSFILSGVATKR